MRIARLLCLLASFVAPALVPAVASAVPANGSLAGSRPNIILIISDDQGYGDASCNGNPLLKTPNIDRLSNEGVRFNDFHVSPTCAPTRSAMLTGKHEFHNGVTHTIYERERMSLKSTTIAQVLKGAGYTTGIFGKWHLGDEDAYQPNRAGFDEVFIHGGGGIGQSYPGSCGNAPGNTYDSPCILHNGTFEKTDGYCTDVFFAKAEQWIDKVKGKQPFFAYLATNAPHAPLTCPAEYAKLYAGKVGPKPAAYFGMIANIDDNIGRLLDKLKQWKIEDNTLVIFLNDNGGTYGCEVFNAGMRGKKGTAHNGGTRAMALWRWPGVLQPHANDQLTAHLDIFPTLAEIAGAKVPDEIAAKLEGFSLVPLLKDPAAAWHDDRILFTHVGRWEPRTKPAKYGQCSVRWRQYLLVRGRKQWQLYDLARDPGEKRDISDKHQDIVARLDKAYDQWWQESLPLMENEGAWAHVPRVNPFKERYWKQYQGPGPNNVAPGKAASSKNEEP